MSQDKQRKKRGKFSLSSLQYVFLHIIWPRRKLVIFGVILIIVNRFSRLVLPGSTKYLMDDVIGKGDTDLLQILLLSVGAALFVQAVTSFVLTRLLSVEAQHMISILRVDVQRHVIQLPVRYFDNTKSGELVSRIMLDVEGVRNLIGTGLV
ncbi:MAG: ABC transporter ATP-binding protein, partial [Acidobacteria bacterium]|nr:ABC transporter ATP-binding protein [Acidobacteriota bacterium]